MLSRARAERAFSVFAAIFAASVGTALGAPAPAPSPSPDPSAQAPHVAPAQIVELALGEQFSCASTTAGEIQCWGRIPAPPKPNGLKKLFAGPRAPFACFTDNDGLHCWGQDTPKIPAGIDPSTISSVALGAQHLCVADAKGVHCTPDASDMPKLSGSEKNVLLTAGYSYTCAWDGSKVACWGSDEFDQLKAPAGFKQPRVLAAGHAHSCVLDEDGVWCWGYNAYGQIDVPSDLANPRALATGSIHTCALDDNGVRCWGTNTEGELNLPELKNPRLIAAGGWHTCAVDDEGVKCWGYSSDRQTEVPKRLAPN